MKHFKQQGTSHIWEWTEADSGELTITAGCFTGSLDELAKRIGSEQVDERCALIQKALKSLGRSEKVSVVSAGFGDGDGRGDGYGDGRGRGDGYADGDGDGFGDGRGDGRGNGRGRGFGAGHAYGRGDGFVRGVGFGQGYGHGDGCGGGNGKGCGASGDLKKIVVK
jgi:hypothetical protein